VVALLALVLPAASAGAAKPKHVQIVKRHGAFTATLTYTDNHRDPISDMTLRVRHRSRLVLTRKICPLYRPSPGCRWLLGPTRLRILRVGPSNEPALVLDIWSGGNHCCQDTFIAALGKHIGWITREWAGDKGWDYYKIHRSGGGHTLFVTGDGRFFCQFSMCAAATVPIRVFTLDHNDSFVNVTRKFPRLIRADAHTLATDGADPHMTIRKQGSGVLAAWCGDEYLLGRGARCARVLAYAVRHHRPHMDGMEPTRDFVRTLNGDLKRWGYKH
jgi:hypothetical protein